MILRSALLSCLLVTLACDAKKNDDAAKPAVPAPTTSSSAEAAASARIVSVGSANTEIVFALGAGPQVVAVDTSSVYPEQTQSLDNVGYQRTLSAEGVLSKRPSLVLLPGEAGPPPVLAQLRGSGLRIETVDAEPTLEGLKGRITRIAGLLERDAAPLLAQVEREVAEARAAAEKHTSKPKVLVLYARGPGTLLAFGEKTAAAHIVELAHAENAAKGFEGTRPISAEAMVAWAPDLIVVPARGFESLGGVAGVLETPGVKQTPAGKNARIVPLDDVLLLGFGPRLGAGIRALSDAVHAPGDKPTPPTPATPAAGAGR